MQNVNTKKNKQKIMEKIKVTQRCFEGVSQEEH